MRCVVLASLLIGAISISKVTLTRNKENQWQTKTKGSLNLSPGKLISWHWRLSLNFQTFPKQLQEFDFSKWLAQVGGGVNKCAAVPGLLDPPTYP